MASAMVGKQMELEGTIGAFQLPDVLRFLAMGSLTGILTLTTDDRTMGLIIKEGRLIGTTSPNRMLKLGQLLICSAAIRRRDLEEILEYQRDSDHEHTPLGELLVQRGLVTPEQVKQALELQAKEELWEALSWTEGTFKFEHGITASMTHTILALEINKLLDEGAERMEQWREIDRNLRDTSRIYRTRADVAAMPEMRLTPSTWRVLSLLNGQRSLRALIYLSGIGKFETLCAIDSLLMMQLIEPAEQKKKPQPAAPAHAAAPPPGEPEDKKQPEDEESSGLLGLFGRRRRPQAQPENRQIYHGHRGPFVSGAGFACAVLNQLSDRLGTVTQTDDQIAEPLLTESMWTSEGLRYQRADLIQWRDGRLDSSQFDQYLVHAGARPQHMAGCHEDSMAALAAVGRELVKRAVDAYGARASRTVEEVARYFSERVEVGWPTDFMAGAWIQQWIKGE
ncbi:DUF4388 domain-containing protein [bacterium]|nr:DUF4388 domain-containing protein [bacterium]